MQFSFEVNPDLDLAIGVEADTAEPCEQAYQDESIDTRGYHPLTPTEAKPGSEDKVRMLSARYAAGVPLWHDSDCYDHGPSDAAFDGTDEFGGFDDEEDE